MMTLYAMQLPLLDINRSEEAIHPRVGEAALCISEIQY